MKRSKKKAKEKKKFRELDENMKNTKDIRSNSSPNYENPPIPKGYKHIHGGWNDGFVIERISDGSEFTWVPVGSLQPNGTIDGAIYNQRFGRRSYRTNKFSENYFFAPWTEEFLLQKESVEYYGGFYVSTYNIGYSDEEWTYKYLDGSDSWQISCKDWKQEKFYSKRGMIILNGLTDEETRKVANSIESSDNVKSHMLFGAEYDSILEWFITSNARTWQDVVKNSSMWGNYGSNHYQIRTGEEEKYCTNNIYDFTGNLQTRTQEKWQRTYPVLRGGYYRWRGTTTPAACRGKRDLPFIACLRVALYIKIA